MQISVISGPDAGKIFALGREPTVCVGRGSECEVQLIDPSVSRIHFEIRISEGRAILHDAGSRWGTLVNGSKADTYELRPGDVITVGDTNLRWLPEARPEASTIAPPRRHGAESPAGIAQPVPLAPKTEEAGVPKGAAKPSVNLRSLVGQSFGNYLVQSVQAESRSGIVFLATDRDSRQPVALKLFWPNFMQRRDAVERFLRTIQTMSPLRHPNLVVLLEADQTEGICWTASEFVVGMSARQLIQQSGVAGMLDWQRVLSVAFDIARALEFAASHGIVHRNITPSNILVQKSDGVAKLGDLQLAKAIEEFDSAAVTRAGEILGDLPYLSPEQTLGERLSHRSDLYGLGATLYALLAGRPPCEGLTTAETVIKIQAQRPEPPTKYHLSIPAIFEGVVMRLLAKHPDDRFPDATKLLKELERVEKYTRPVPARNADPDATEF